MSYGRFYIEDDVTSLYLGHKENNIMFDGFITVLLTALIFGALIFIHEFGHFITARICGVGVKEFAIGMGPKIFSWKSKKYGTVYGVRALPIGGFVSMVGEDEESEEKNAFCNKSVFKRILIIIAGPLMNLLLGFLLMALFVTSQPMASTTVAEFDDNAISNQKLQVNDTIVVVDGTPVLTGNDVLYEIMYNGNAPIDIVVFRDGKFTVLKDVSFPTFEDSEIIFGDMDFKIKSEEKNPLTVIKHTVGRSVSTVKMIIDSVVGLINGRFGLDSVSGPVGVAGEIGNAAKEGFWYVIYLVIVLSVNLGVFNLIPFPALDGGRLLFLLIEAVRKKPIRKEVESYINFAGIIILFGFMIFIMGKDILNLFR